MYLPTYIQINIENVIHNDVSVDIGMRIFEYTFKIIN